MENNDEGVMILVVGTDTPIKSRVADALRYAASEYKPIQRGVRNFPRNSEAVVVNTVPLKSQYMGSQIFQEAKRWIAENGLRRMLGKQVCIVCVISVADALMAKDSIDNETNFYLHDYSWLQFLGDFIFPEHRQSIIFVAVNGDDQFDDDTALTEMQQMRNFIRRHRCFSRNYITFADLRDRDSFINIVNSTVGNIFRFERRENSPESHMLSKGQVTFQIRHMPSNSRNITSLGPWVPERIILFGRAGSGKSTLAQMLTLGRLDPHSELFKSGSGIRGQTTRIHHGEGRGWYVVDTPGFGEQKGGSITSKEAERMLKRYVQMIEGIYTHYAYVVKKGRIDKLEAILWSFFVTLFGEAIKDHFTVVVSEADRFWLAENIDHLKKCFPGCESFLSAEFPSMNERDEELEKESQEIREESLKELEHGLMSLQRVDTWCDLGEWSKMTELYGVSNAVFDIHAMPYGIQRVVTLMRIGAYRVSTGLHRLSILLTQEDGSLLLPLESLDD